MEDYEKFDQMIENSDSTTSDRELDFMLQIVQELKNDQPATSSIAQAKSQRLMLAEAKEEVERSKARRISTIGSLYGWAVPAILLLAVVGAVFGNSQRNSIVEPATIESGSAPSLQEPAETELNIDAVAPDADKLQEAISEPTMTLTETETITGSMSIEPVELPAEDDETPYPAPENDTILYDEYGEEIELPVPQRPPPDSQIKPTAGSEDD